MKCQLCNSEKRDDLRYGEFLQKDGKGVHTFCLYLTSNLCQSGKDNEGFLGFLFVDIAGERQRVAQQNCYYCGKSNANISCCKQRCRRAYHLICGLDAGVAYQFIKTFRSFCHKHVPKVLSRPRSDEICCICYDALIGEGERFSMVNMLQAPCCRNGWFHKYCLQRCANTAAYFFKCPLCNDSDVFRERMSYTGIFIPERDAAWELEPNAYEELLERPSVCAAPKCHNDAGRAANVDADPLLMCRLCGSEARHQNCLPPQAKNFECKSCEKLLGDDSGRESEENTRPADACNMVMAQTSTEQLNGANESEDVDVENSSVDDGSASESEDDGGYDFLGTVIKAIEDIKRGGTAGNDRNGARNKAQSSADSKSEQQHATDYSSSSSRIPNGSTSSTSSSSTTSANVSCDRGTANASNISCIGNRTRRRMLADSRPESGALNISCIANRTRRKSTPNQHNNITKEDTTDTDASSDVCSKSKVKKPRIILLSSSDSEDDTAAMPGTSRAHSLNATTNANINVMPQASAATSRNCRVHSGNGYNAHAENDTSDSDIELNSHKRTRRTTKCILSSSADSDTEQSQQEIFLQPAPRQSLNMIHAEAKKRKSSSENITETAQDSATRTTNSDRSIVNGMRRRSDIHDDKQQTQNPSRTLGKEQNAVEESSATAVTTSHCRSIDQLDMSCIANRTRRRSDIRVYKRQKQSAQQFAAPRRLVINYKPLEDIAEENADGDDDDDVDDDDDDDVDDDDDDDDAVEAVTDDTAKQQHTTSSSDTTYKSSNNFTPSSQSSFNSVAHSASTSYSPQYYSCNTTPSSTISSATLRKRAPRPFIRRRLYSSEDDDDFVLTSFAPRYNVDPYLLPKYKRVNNKLKRGSWITKRRNHLHIETLPEATTSS